MRDLDEPFGCADRDVYTREYGVATDSPDICLSRSTKIIAPPEGHAPGDDDASNSHLSSTSYLTG